ncbi:hypothetical protein SD77_3085 [Bacillus badius]|uniref:Ribose 5-phosphate isomerase B n=1 Tax=Bacillus badius TaxID=1455 RepID=A0ABR5AWU4_BACBA|nr:hypothetical protein SD78_0318 [Bacillus badius]KIL79219.1 hypothetical protein SD77_3085 [Bacillus badius]
MPAQKKFRLPRSIGAGIYIQESIRQQSVIACPLTISVVFSFSP